MVRGALLLAVELADMIRRSAVCLFVLTAIAVAAAKPAAEREVREAEDAWARAAMAGDATVLTRLLADDIVYTHTSGKADTKTQFIESITTGRLTYRSAEVEEFAAKVYGNVAVTLSVRRMSTGSGGQFTSFRARFQRVWVKRGGQWRLTAHQATRIAD
jgi:uncharacterized protein (TIGR02246 family)